MANAKIRIAVSLVSTVLVADLITKSWALDALADGRRIDLLGGLVPLTLAFNRGAAFGISIGSDPRWFFIPVTVIAIGFLLVLLRQAEVGDHLRVVSGSLVLAGATGNLVDRVRWDRGVVDFIGPVDLGFMHWPIFNVADSAITTGAVLLAISFWVEDARIRRGEREGADRASGPDPRGQRPVDAVDDGEEGAGEGREPDGEGRPPSGSP